jgi:hypothetical protein
LMALVNALDGIDLGLNLINGISALHIKCHFFHHLDIDLQRGQWNYQIIK